MRCIPKQKQRADDGFSIPLGGFDHGLKAFGIKDLIVVHHQDVFRVARQCPADSDVGAFGEPQIAVPFDNFDSRKFASDRLAGSIRRSVINDHNTDIEAR